MFAVAVKSGPLSSVAVVLMPRFLELCEALGEGINRIALGIDLRERAFFGELPGVIDHARSKGHRVEVLFLDASKAVLDSALILLRLGLFAQVLNGADKKATSTTCRIENTGMFAGSGTLRVAA